MRWRPEQYRLAGLRNSLRLVSTAECRALRAASVGEFDAVDHVMTYLFADTSALPDFEALGAALDKAGRMSPRLPSVAYLTGDMAGRIAAPRAAAGADVIPWRPALGVYLIIEEKGAAPEALIDVPGVAGIWWYRSFQAAARFGPDRRDLQITYCYLDSNPTEVAPLLGDRVKERWASLGGTGLLAAPFFVILPFDWSRHLP